MGNENKIGRPSKGGRDFNSTVAERIREITNGETQQQIADKTGISRQAVGRIANGENKPDSDTLHKFAKAYNVSADYLLGLSDVKSSDTTIQDICTITHLDEDTVKEIAYIGSKYPTLLAEFVKEGHLLSILRVISYLKSEGEYFLKCGAEASTIIDSNIFEEYRSKNLNAIRYQAFSAFEQIMDKYDVRITKKDEISILSKAITEIRKEYAEDNFQESLKMVREYKRGKNNGSNRTKKE
jgi:transcriptional regulator with XRE-family HTH domain